ncbi:MAG: class I SAM-dependent methyltransferase [Myroides sp.]|jgi:SAM-dependent methyltransferase|uniref:class I SAM-dependent methyltransferase n=1 Tax=Myroides marinus TaxID=703342 RepID=UPI0025759E14|nr:class I SAM-dependent methyltransferase [Myroides marinus]MDM1379280.1 class I SAM-dependent methyltransferase [Myroides marinus]MDM1386585.1 class I SAM-dependent methyltransferase [Myroides marinus]MDM1393764.1 class I SAM-dependent methyltransferase [Myroides marinus]MDR0194891.1 class I SAM-dependent methyltransferase [Myroides sp.]
MKDLLGKAILDFQTNNNPQNVITETDISEAEEMDIAYLFRSYKEMPKIEQKALNLAKGNILDVGCGAGAHTYYLQEKGFEVKAIDISPSSIEACKLRGIKNAEVLNLLDIKDEKFDTILLLMNGTGIFGRLVNTTKYLQHLKSLLNPGGQILIDSSDLIYMFDEDEDGGKWIPMENKDYYGELTFTVAYKGEEDEPLEWLYLDYNTLQNAAHSNGLNCDLITEGENCDYLAKLTLI